MVQFHNISCFTFRVLSLKSLFSTLSIEKALLDEVLQLPDSPSMAMGSSFPAQKLHSLQVPTVPTMGCGFADPRDLRQQSSDLCLGSDMS